MPGGGYCAFAAVLLIEYEVKVTKSWRLSLLLLLGVLLRGGILFWLLKSRSQNGRISSISLGGAYCWMLLHVAVNCIYYTTAFKPSMTYRPPWIKWLG